MPPRVGATFPTDPASPTELPQPTFDNFIQPGGRARDLWVGDLWRADLQVGEPQVEVGALESAVDLEDLPGDVARRV